MIVLVLSIMDLSIGMNENYLTRIFGYAETLCSFETLQSEHYGKVALSCFNPGECWQGCI